MKYVLRKQGISVVFENTQVVDIMMVTNFIGFKIDNQWSTPKNKARILWKKYIKEGFERISDVTYST
jgi:hypothetical protein